MFYEIIVNIKFILEIFLVSDWGMLEFNNVIIENCVVIVEKLENCGYWVDVDCWR